MLYNWLQTLCGESTAAEILGSGAVVLAIVIIASAIGALWQVLLNLPGGKK